MTAASAPRVLVVSPFAEPFAWYDRHISLLPDEGVRTRSFTLVYTDVAQPAADARRVQARLVRQDPSDAGGALRVAATAARPPRLAPGRRQAFHEDAGRASDPALDSRRCWASRHTRGVSVSCSLVLGILCALALAPLVWRRTLAAMGGAVAVTAVVALLVVSTAAAAPFVAWRIVEDVRYTSRYTSPQAERIGGDMAGIDWHLYTLAARPHPPARHLLRRPSAAAAARPDRDPLLVGLRPAAADPRRRSARCRLGPRLGQAARRAPACGSGPCHGSTCRTASRGSTTSRGCGGDRGRRRARRRQPLLRPGRLRGAAGARRRGVAPRAASAARARVPDRACRGRGGADVAAAGGRVARALAVLPRVRAVRGARRSSPGDGSSRLARRSTAGARRPCSPCSRPRSSCCSRSTSTTSRCGRSTRGRSGR